MKKAPELFESLKEYIRGLGPVAVAFSGGLDSRLLLEAAFAVRGNSCYAITISAMMTPASETAQAEEYCAKRNIQHSTEHIDMGIFPEFISNPATRCYHCKKIIFSRIMEIARSAEIPRIIEGTHLDDLFDYRPGIRALEELGVASPFATLHMGKKEITCISRELGIEGLGLPSNSCLATRIPFGTPLTDELLRRVESAEDYIKSLGFTYVRVRSHGDIARIEVSPEFIPVITLPENRQRIAGKLHCLGYDFVTIDMDGYRQGSMNSHRKGTASV